ncbi:hypothetical protein Acr_29g0005700 [Actinidia rufa]|uniref:Uncharacterized protein n=1 Tax=Actinidia rufa TaxID=165716 RepID=A0A7J0HEC5_9ERIC|nr:hypothetical protein Acr_29g0005700 [Actinidia rufa]
MLCSTGLLALGVLICKLTISLGANTEYLVKLEGSESHDPYDQNSPDREQKKATDKYNAIEFKLKANEENDLRRIEDENVALAFEKVHPIGNDHSKSEDKVYGKTKLMSDYEKTRTEHGGVLLSRTDNLGFDIKPSLFVNDGLDFGKSCTVQHEDVSQKKFPLRSQGLTKEELGNRKADSAEGSRIRGESRLNVEKRQCL